MQIQGPIGLLLNLYIILEMNEFTEFPSPTEDKPALHHLFLQCMGMSSNGYSTFTRHQWVASARHSGQGGGAGNGWTENFARELGKCWLLLEVLFDHQEKVQRLVIF